MEKVYIFSSNVGGIVVDHMISRFFDSSICFGDICNPSLKSEIAPNFARVFALPQFWGAGHKNLYPNFYPYLAAHHVDKNVEVILTGPNVII